MLNILLLAMRCVIYHVVYASVDAEEEAQNRNTENTRIMWFSFDSLHPRGNPLRATSSLLYKSLVQNMCYNEPKHEYI